MLFNKVKFIAQVIGFVCIGLLAVYGGVIAVTGSVPVWAAASDVEASALTPQLISYQGTLRDANDQPAEGTYDMVVRIYDNAGATGTPLWSETHNNVIVREGRFNLLLGQSSPIPASVFTSPNRYIQLTVNGTPMNPTQRFAAVPYAISATYATQLSAPDGDPANAVTVANDGDVDIRGSVQFSETPLRQAINLVRQDYGLGVQRFTQYYRTTKNFAWYKGGSHRAAELDPGGGTLQMVIEDGDVGIGVAHPTARLHIPYQGRGNTILIGEESDLGGNNFELSLSLPSGAAHWPLGITRDGDRVAAFDQDGNLQVDAEGSSYFMGNVGIGTDRPAAKLDVEGVINADSLNVSGDISWSGDLRTMRRSRYYVAESDMKGTIATTMEPFSNSICYLAKVHFRDLDDKTENAWCNITARDGHWVLEAHASGGSSRDDVFARCEAGCLMWGGQPSGTVEQDEEGEHRQRNESAPLR